MSDQDKPDEIDQLLEEAKKPEPQVDQQFKQINDKLETVTAEIQADRKEKAQQDVSAAVDALSEKIPEAFKENPMFSREALEDYLQRQANSDKALEEAFVQRRQNPSAWEAARGKLVENFAAKFENLPDPALTEDREAVLASAKETKPTETVFDEKAIGEMSTADFNEEQRKLGVTPYGG